MCLHMHVCECLCAYECVHVCKHAYMCVCVFVSNQKLLVTDGALGSHTECFFHQAIKNRK